MGDVHMTEHSNGGSMEGSGEKLAILDAGSQVCNATKTGDWLPVKGCEETLFYPLFVPQFGKLIDRRCRELKVQTVILPLDASPYQLKVSFGFIFLKCSVLCP